ncbi:methylated-DNA--[protein]-cysteine S-methyltransferase [Planctomicrobium piriforme]|uniref:methylated-DNA--[protein]-cysteine S-methyltransferase n=1 Tax=Planctomicrobium piriforme TaxID=1576369 RepID=A0A1I3JUZ8_9PLAN|nr:methylated-DNA--[protein]-cysteine S-methyltransferase [Planctomicrobium piriforme]SFI64072.1 methylated-DNA-[protein]-cysteine S-methyltransferase [Planctomicrobium piriforme]
MQTLIVENRADVDNAVAACIFQTDLGWFGLRGTENGLTALTFGHAGRTDVVRVLRQDAEEGDLPRWMEHAVELLQQFSRGESVDLTEIPLDISHRTPFERRVREQLARIGYGQTISYGELAAAAGKPGAARAVGTVMSKNPVPLVIPCHRVLAAGGKLGGYSAPSGLAMKRRLLDMESLACGQSRE